MLKRPSSEWATIQPESVDSAVIQEIADSAHFVRGLSAGMDLGLVDSRDEVPENWPLTINAAFRHV